MNKPERNRLMRRSLLAGCLLLISSTTPLSGQGNDRSAEMHHRNQCRLAAQVLSTGNPAPKRDWARDYITTCTEEGPRILAEQWRAAAADTGALRYLVLNTGRMRDARLYEALREVAADRSRPDLARVGAMLALARYVDPHNAIWFSDVRVTDRSVRRIPLVTSWSTNGVQLIGSRPIGPVAQPVLALLDSIAGQRETENRNVWYAAAVLAKRVRTDIEYGRAK
ncbi:MAG: hypothetical protein M3220_17580 [Chloroflexota bacterium]|nr:hypothetical protein [Chloroflexota bacterium]